MRTVTAAVAAAALLVSVAAAGAEEMGGAGGISVHDAYARATVGRGTASTAYMTLVNEGAAADRLAGVTSPAAETAGLHTHTVEGGVARMRPVDAIEVAPGAPTVLQPGGLHVMLMGLKGPLEEGATVPLTLSFEEAGEIELELPVR